MFLWFIGIINHFGYGKNTRRIRKSLACGPITGLNYISKKFQESEKVKA